MRRKRTCSPGSEGRTRWLRTEICLRVRYDRVNFSGSVMRTAATFLVLAVLAGCAVVPSAAWNVDPTQPPAARTLPPEEFAALSQRVAALQAERAQIRGRIAAERDVAQRQREEAQLHRVGMELSPLERQLAAAAPAR